MESRRGDGRFDRLLQDAIEESLREMLGQTIALATRVCLDTRVALEDPRTYLSVLETLLGNRRASVIRRMERKLQAIGPLQSAGVAGFCESIEFLRGHYAAETLARWK